MRVFIKNGSGDYSRLFQSLGYEVCDDIGSADLVCFTGGADVTPHYYGDKAHALTGNNTHRDEDEKRLFERALEAKLPMVGICRGGQFLNVMSGGRMYQDVTGHCGDHELVDLETGETVLVSSTHHQMMMPSDEAAIIATSINIRSKREWYDNQIFRKDISDEGVEVVYYPHTNCLCFQPHPEFVREHYKSMRNYFNSLLERCFELQATQVA